MAVVFACDARFGLDFGCFRWCKKDGFDVLEGRKRMKTVQDARLKLIDGIGTTEDVLIVKAEIEELRKMIASDLFVSDDMKNKYQTRMSSYEALIEKLKEDE
jgi:hypothetical protein